MKTKYDWRYMPDWVQYVAEDSYGQRMAFEREPFIHIGGFWANYVGEYCFLEQVEPSENWKDSLEKRPKTLGTKEEIEHVIKMVLLGNGIDYETEVRFSNIASDCAEIIISRLGIKP